MKKIYSFILLALITTGCYAQVFSVDFLLYEVIDEDKKEVALTGFNWNYSGELPKTVTVPSSVTDPGDGKSYTVTLIAGGAFRWDNTFNTIILPSSIKEIGYQAFYQASSLTSVTLPEGVTTIGEEAFYQSSLSSLTLSKSITSIGERAFAYTKLATLVLPEGLTVLGNTAFAWNSDLATITIPSTIKDIPEECFLGCIGVTAVNISEGVESIGERAFQGIGPKEIILPSTLKTISYDAFMSPSSPYTRITARMKTPTASSGFDWDTKQVALLVVPDGSLETYKGSDDWSFKYMKEVSQPDPVFFEVNGIRYHAPDETTCEVISSTEGFYNLADPIVILPATVTNPASGKTYKLTALASNCFASSNIEQIILPEGLEEIGDEAFMWTQLNRVKFPSTLKVIGGYAFSGTMLTEAFLNEGLETIGAGAFARCMQLASASLPSTLVDTYTWESGDREKCTGILRGAFAWCPELSSVVSYILDPHDDYMFRDLKEGAVLTVPTGTLDEYCAAASSESWGAFSVIKDQSGKTANRFSVSGDFSGEIIYNGQSYYEFAAFVPAGTSYTFGIKPYEGYAVTSVKLGDVDITDQITDGLITIVTDGTVQVLTIKTVEQLILSEDIMTFNHWNNIDLKGQTGPVEAYAVTEYDYDSNTAILTRTYEIPTWTGIILIGTQGDKLNLETADDAPTISGNMLIGTYSNSVANPSEWINGETHYNYILKKDDSAPLKYSFFKIQGDETYEHNWAYLSIPASKLPATAPEKINIQYKGAVGIKGVKGDNRSGDVIYDMQGRRITKPSRGINIINGQKVLIP